MPDIICVDDYFSSEAREFYEKYGVVTPYLDAIYSVREVVITRIGHGLLLNELINPRILLGEGESGFTCEPNWRVSRFKNLDGTEISKEQLNNFKLKPQLV